MTATERLRNPSVPRSVRLDIISSGLCTYCGDPADTIDHDVPVSRGGTDDLDNLVPSCWPCNSRKHSLTGAEYRAQQELLARVPVNEELLNDLLEQRTEDQTADLISALAEVGRRYSTAERQIEALILQGGSIIRAMRVRGWSWRQIDRATNIPQRTAGRWMKLAIEQHSEQEEGGDTGPAGVHAGGHGTPASAPHNEKPGSAPQS